MKRRIFFHIKAFVSGLGKGSVSWGYFAMQNCSFQNTVQHNRQLLLVAWVLQLFLGAMCQPGECVIFSHTELYYSLCIVGV